MNPQDRAFHESFKPSWGLGNVLLYALPEKRSKHRLSLRKGYSLRTMNELSPGGNCVRIAKFSKAPDVSAVLELRTLAADSRKLTQGHFDEVRKHTQISLQDGVPFATPVPHPFDAEFPESTPANAHEPTIWELASILLDDFAPSDIPDSLPANQIPTYETRLRKSRLADFWAQLCRPAALRAVAAARSPEERALAYLSCHAVPEACTALLDAKDFRLATLVAQIGGDTAFHADMGEQVVAWRKQRMLSEMVAPVRALYSLLAGETCWCEGQRGAVEDAAPDFVLSERFGWSWMQAFGVRLWYGVADDASLETAVRAFAKDLQRRETARPRPWFLAPDAQPKPTWHDPDPEAREDVLWGLLKLHAERAAPAAEPAPTDLAAATSPENATGRPLQHRLSFALYHALAPHFPRAARAPRADALALAFAAELEAAGRCLWALLVLLHVADASARTRAVQALLAARAPDLDERDDALFAVVLGELQVPVAWVWEAKALHARAVTRDARAEVRYLLRAGDVEEAHRVLCATVAPGAVIERDAEGLVEVLEEFQAEKPAGWGHGGGVYADYLTLLHGEDGQIRVLKKLVAALVETGKRLGKDGFLQRVATHEMSRVVADKVLEHEDLVSPSTPLTLGPRT